MGKRITTIYLQDDLHETLKRLGEFSPIIDKALRLYFSTETKTAEFWFEEFKALSREIQATNLEGKLKPLTALSFFNRIKALGQSPAVSIDDRADYEATTLALLQTATNKDVNYEQSWGKYFEEAYARLKNTKP